jgi:hypothetical protein
VKLSVLNLTVLESFSVLEECHVPVWSIGHISGCTVGKVLICQKHIISRSIMVKFMVQCVNKKCKEYYYINEPNFPPNLNQNSFLDNLFSSFACLAYLFVPRDKLESSQLDQNNREITYIFGCYKCGVQNAVNIPLSSSS